MPLLKNILLQAIVTGCVAAHMGQIAHAQVSSNKTVTKKAVTQGSSGSTGNTTQRRTAPPTGTVKKVAGAPGRAPLDDRPARPQAQTYRIPKLSPEMEDILVEWEQKSAKIKRLEGAFERTTYDSVFAVEHLAKGKYCFEFPDKGSFEQKGIDVKDGQKGRRYLAKKGPDERWVCDGNIIRKIDDKAKQFEEVEIPKEDRGQNIKNSPLPFLFGMKADEAKLRYSFELVKDPKKPDPDRVHLKVKPLLQQDLANYSKAEVILDRATFVPRAVKLLDTTGNKEDVYFFVPDKLTINGRGGWAQWLAGDPLKPDLTGYKKAVSPGNDVGAAPGIQMAPRPTDRRTTSKPTSKTLGPRSEPERTAQRLDDEEERPARATTKGISRP